MENNNETKPTETLDLSKIMDEFSEQLKETTEWNEIKKDFPWNTSSTQKVSVECLSAQESGQYDPKPVKAVDMINSLFLINFHNEKHHPYLGPTGINEWILSNLVSQLNPTGLVSWFKKHSSQHPYGLYQRYLLIQDFIVFCSNELQIKVDSLDNNDLSKQDLYLAFAAKAKLSDKKPNILSSLYLQFQPFSKLNIPSNKRTVKPYFSHPFVERHLQSLKHNGRKQQSVNKNKAACRDFLTWLCHSYREFNDFNCNNVPLHLIKQFHLLEYRLFMKRQILIKLKDDKSTSTNFYYVRSLFHSLYQMSLIKEDIAFGIKGLPFDDYHYREIPSNKEIQCFFDIVRTYSPKPFVHLLIYSLMLYLGLRISEVINLVWENFNRSTWSVSFKGKNGQYSTFSIPEQIKHQIELHFKTNLKGSIINEDPVAFENDLTNYHQLYCLVAGWTFKRKGFHLFRHIYITKLSEQPQCTPKLLMRLARHVKPASTSKYIHRSSQILQQAVEKIDYTLP